MSKLVLKKPLASPETVIVSLTPSIALIVYSAKHLFEKDLGAAGLVEERKIEEDRWVFVEDCKHPKSVTLHT